ncbi:hypothetical protein MKZ02_22550 [Pseudobacillus sp. FSL P4-0506]|uniref:hypothetical protein n=1 Tax=Pseudobacillus sp. FSL P4-0506 TaxID=2921576 RepID=UPI0030F90ECD
MSKKLVRNYVENNGYLYLGEGYGLIFYTNGKGHIWGVNSHTICQTFSKKEGRN